MRLPQTLVLAELRGYGAVQRLPHLAGAVVHAHHVLLQDLGQLVVVADVAVAPVHRGRIQVQEVAKEDGLVVQPLWGPLDLGEEGTNGMRATSSPSITSRGPQ